MQSEIFNLQERVTVAISQGEGNFREFKSILHGPPGNKIVRDSKSICRDIGEALVAFANADSGSLLIGVEDNGEITGIEQATQSQIEYFQKAPISQVHPKTPLPAVQSAILEINNHKVLYFYVPKSTQVIHLTADGRCVQRRDLETVPIPPDEITFGRQERTSMNYDREFVDNASTNDLNVDLVRILADTISQGMSLDKCLQYLDLGEYTGPDMRLRRAALLLFAKNPTYWHPRLQLRVISVKGNALGAGNKYNVKSDQTVTGNILELLDKGWNVLRPQLAQTRLGKEARFESTVMYPEFTCREALTNAIAHRDFSEEGRGIEIYVFDDRMEIKNPGALLSSVKIEDLIKLQGIHQSRNAYVSRVLKELGYMQELGEGMRRIFDLMKVNELTPPELNSENNSFTITLRHNTMYNPSQLLWLQQFEKCFLDREQKAIVVLGIGGDLIAPQDIIDNLGIIDIEHYRQLVKSLQDLGIIKSQISKSDATRQARRKKISVRKIPRFRISSPTSTNPAINLEIVNQTEVTKNLVPLPKLENRLYLGNLAYDVTEEQIMAFLSRFGDIEDFYLPKSKYGSKGFAFVEFQTKSDINEMLKNLDGQIFQNRRLTVRLAEPHIKSSSK